MPISEDLLKELIRGWVAQRKLGKQIKGKAGQVDALLAQPEFADLSDEEKYYVQQRFLGLEVEAIGLMD